LIQLFPRLVPPGEITYTIDARIDLRLAAFGVAIALATALVVALASASKIGSAGAVSDLKGGRSSPRGFRTQHHRPLNGGWGVVSPPRPRRAKPVSARSAKADAEEVATLYLPRRFANEAAVVLEKARRRLSVCLPSW
jgi:hypothetical protein